MTDLSHDQAMNWHRLNLCGICWYYRLRNWRQRRASR